MKKNFLKIGLFLALGVTTAMFYSCSDNKDEPEQTNPNNPDDGNGNETPDGKDNPGGNANADGTFTITAINVLGNTSQIATVKAEMYWETDYYDYGYDVIAQAPYENNGFTLKLPASVAAKHLEPLIDDEDVDYWDSFTVSDKQAKVASIFELGGYDESDNEIGGFWFGQEKYNDFVMWIYVDRNVTIKGEEKEIDEEYNEEYIGKIDVNLKKGWNVMYGKETASYNSLTGRTVYTGSTTTQKPSGVNYKWYFDSYDNEEEIKQPEEPIKVEVIEYSAPLKSAKSLSDKKSFLSKMKGNRR